jgi:histidinol dehydrogenase
MLRQTEQLSRRDLIRKVLAEGTLIVVVKNLNDGMALCNAFAPEHFELLVKNPRRWAGQVRAAGAIFIGPWTPESAGDFVADRVMFCRPAGRPECFPV